nr:T9SS type A sorting domain-containing protein [Chitinophagaceae bacterium]
VLLYPNPAINEVNLAVTVSKADKAQLRIIDNMGRVVKQQQLNLTAGSTSLSIDVSILAKGMYYMELRGETMNERKGFVKQ